MNQAASFFDVLFDFSFTTFVTSKLVKVLYALSVIGAGLLALVLVMMGFEISQSVGIITLLIVAPLVFFFIVIYARVLLEFMIVVFRISEHVAQIAERTSKDAVKEPV